MPSRPARNTPNKTETRFAQYVLDPLVYEGVIETYVYEPFALIMAKRLRYTPDFVVREAGGAISIYEVKGPHIWEDARVKYYMAREMYGHLFKFSAYQWKDREWREIWI